MNPGAGEVCDAIDNDCEGTVDESATDAPIWYQDFDVDGFGDDATSVASCAAPDGYVATGGDCYDLDSSVNISETWFVDDDRDGWGAEPIVSCVQPAGTVALAGDCDDGLAGVNPVAPEVCEDGLDNDCEGTDKTCAGGIDFVNVAAGTFEMGCTAGQSDCGADETVHTVTLTQDYYVGETEVTQAQFDAVMGYNPSYFTSCGGDCPVEGVDWHEAAAFANALSTADGLDLCFACTGSGTASECSVAMNPYDCEGYRLLTEAEWEGAARCGEDLLYAGSNVVDEVAWYSENSDSSQPVGGKVPNVCGLYDMSGNVWEWTQDWYESSSASDAHDPVGATVGSNLVVRGGSWGSSAEYARVGQRVSYPPAYADSVIQGFRLARSNP